MPSRLVVLLLLAAALGCASAGRDLGAAEEGDLSPSSRQLLQGPAAEDCDRSVKHCQSCRFQFFRGTVTKAICTRCEAGYVVKNSGRACYCAPGYYTAESTSVSGQQGFTCQPCGPDAYCPGAKVTAASSSVRYTCGANKITTTEYGKSDRECMVKPGFGWSTGDDSAPCPQGFYNPGYNTRKCSKCPGSLTTLGTNSNSTQDCMAPQGSYYLRGKAIACARGTYKDYIGNNDCDECPTGMTTVQGTVSADSKTLCNTVEPGYKLVANPVLGVTEAEECPPNTYRAGDALVTATSAAVTCTPCGNGMVTLPNVTRATTPDACVVPPGYGWQAPAPGSADTKGAAVKCSVGFYNPGYNREACVQCGQGTITTDGEGATDADQCLTPAGHGNRRDADGVLEGFACPLNTYGRGNKTYGLVDVECTKCLDNTHTNAEGSMGQTSCLTDAGFGWDDGSVNQCDYGYYNPGDNQNKCTFCGDFFNTTNDATAFEGDMGSDAASDCKYDFGYQGTASSPAEACLRGWYKDYVGFGNCNQCPAGTSTTLTQAAVAKTDCDVCRPGFGAGTNNGKIDLSNPQAITCSICPSGKWSGGFKQGGENCAVCPQAQNFTGLMVSPQGAWTPEQCFGQFPSDPENEQNFQAWDTIAHSDPTTFVRQPAISTMAACQIGCRTDAECQYFEFWEAGAPQSAGANACFFRKVAGADVTALSARIGGADLAWWNAPTGVAGIVMFEIGDNFYTAYPKKATETIGEVLELAASNTDFVAMRTACDKSADCIGLTWDAATQWRGFRGTLWEGAVGKVRVVGNAINSWVKIPTGTEEPEGWTPQSVFVSPPSSP